MSKVGRNDPCPCGSGIKYKRCHEKVNRRMIQLNVKKPKKKLLSPQGFQRCFLKLVKDAGGSVDISCKDLDAIPKDEALSIRHDAEEDSFHFGKVVVKKSPIITANKRLRLPN